MDLTIPKIATKKCLYLSAYFVLHSPGGRCNRPMSITIFFCPLHIWFTSPYFFIFQFFFIVEVFLISVRFILSTILTVALLVVAVANLARWNFLCTLYNWFARPILFLFFKFFTFEVFRIFFDFLYWLFRSLFNFFNLQIWIFFYICL